MSPALDRSRSISRAPRRASGPRSMPAKWPPSAVGEPTIAIVVDAVGGWDVLGAGEVGVIVIGGSAG